MIWNRDKRVIVLPAITLLATSGTSYLLAWARHRSGAFSLWLCVPGRNLASITTIWRIYFHDVWSQSDCHLPNGYVFSSLCGPEHTHLFVVMVGSGTHLVDVSQNTCGTGSRPCSQISLCYSNYVSSASHIPGCPHTWYRIESGAIYSLYLLLDLTLATVRAIPLLYRVKGLNSNPFQPQLNVGLIQVVVSNMHPQRLAPF